MFAKGPVAGNSPKSDALKLDSTLYSESILYGDQRIYAVKNGQGVTLGASANARNAWIEALWKTQIRLRSE